MRSRIWLPSAVLLAASLLPCAPLHAQSAPQADPNWEKVCDAAKSQPLPPPVSAGPLTADQLAHCNETKLYYGYGDPPDYPAALQCGWYQYAHPQHTQGNMVYGPGVLAMLYANGYGVARNFDLAIRFACENDWAAEAEDTYRIGHLESLKTNGPGDKPFDLCDDTTSGLSDGTCTSIQAAALDTVRRRRIDALVATLPPAARAAFPALQAAESAFEDARIRNEVDLSGTSRAAFQLDEEAKLRDQFLINLQRCGKGDLPSATPAQIAALDRKLNEVYQQIQHAPASQWQYVTVNPAGIRATEEKWIALRDAWISFARLALPRLPVSSLQSELIRLRLHQLHSLLGS